MTLFIFRFWPALMPLLLYLIWWWWVRRKAAKAGAPKPRFSDGPLYWMIMSSFAIGILCFIYLGTTMKGDDSEYRSPHMQRMDSKEGTP